MARLAAWIRTLTCLLLLIGLLGATAAGAAALEGDDSTGAPPPDVTTNSDPINPDPNSQTVSQDTSGGGGGEEPTDLAQPSPSPLPADPPTTLETPPDTSGTGGTPQDPVTDDPGTPTSGGSDTGSGSDPAATDPAGGTDPGGPSPGDAGTPPGGDETTTVQGDGATDGTPDTSGADPSAAPDDAAAARTEQSEAIEEPTDVLESILPAALTKVTVYTYLCTSDPGSVTPGTTPTECGVQPAVELSAVVDDADVLDGIFTDQEGVASFDAPVGAKLFVEELLANGLEPLTDGFALIDELPAGGATLAFLNVTEEVAAGTGRLQVVSATCPTLGAGHTEWRVIGPFRVAAQDDGCKPNLMAYFTITGGVYGDDGLTVPTDRDGTWRGRLAPGTYTIFEDATGSSSGAVQVVAGDTTVVVALNYQGQPNGSVEIYRFLCNASAPSTEISIAATSGAPAAPDATCDMAAGTVQLNDGTPFILEAGSRSMPMPLGAYTFTDLATGQQRPFSIDLGSTTRVVVVERMQAGVVDVRSLFCRNPAAGGVDPRNSHYFFWTCDNVDAGVNLTLRDAYGNSVGQATSNGSGFHSWRHVPVGVHTIASGRRNCAIFVSGGGSIFNWADGPSVGFGVAAGGTTSVSLYGCLANSFATAGAFGGDGSGPGYTSGNPTGGLPAASSGGASTNPTVTTLPNTGAGPAPAVAGQVWTWIATMTLLVAAGGVTRWRRRFAG